MMASALADAEPVACDGAAVRLRPLGGNPMTGEGLTRGRAAIEGLIGRVLGTAVRVTVADGPPAPRPDAPPPGPGAAVREAAAPPAPPQRVSVTGAKAERLKALRQKDPTLGSAMDSLDLELLD